MREYALSLGRELPERALEVIDKMKSESKVYQYCLRFPVAEKPKPAPKKKAPAKKVKLEEKKGDE